MHVKVLVAIAMGALLSGCFSVVRFPCEDLRYTKYSYEGECTNRVYTTFLNDIRRKPGGCPLGGLYPTFKMRVYVTKEIYFSDNYYLDDDGKPLTGERLYKRKWGRRTAWFPLAVIWLTTPFDAVVDTICIPWDWGTDKPEGVSR